MRILFHGILECILLGSVSQAATLHAKCSVEIVRSPKAQRPENADKSSRVMREHTCGA